MPKKKTTSQISPSLDREMDFNRLRDALIILPWLAFILLLSPVLNFFGPKVLLWGIPASVLQLLTSWLGIIILIFLINRGLRSTIDSRDQ